MDKHEWMDGIVAEWFFFVVVAQLFRRTTISKAQLDEMAET